MTFADRRLARVALSLALMLGALIILPTLFPHSAFGQAGSRSAAQTGATAADAGQSVAVERGESDGLKVFALRLRPGQDLRKELERFTKERGLRAGFIITTVGSLQKASLRLADKSEATSFDGKFEIVSLVGTLARDGVHLHISISDGTGRTVGGHLVEGCQIYTTAEIVIGEVSGMVFSRETDKATGYKELTIRQQRRLRKRR
ncbi:MAG: PPC domain-containing DNA-binding protein [Pyrinomonadaceae bacterium]